MNKKPKIIGIYNKEDKKFFEQLECIEKCEQKQDKININETFVNLKVHEINNKDNKKSYDYNKYENIVDGINFIKGLKQDERFKSTFIIVSSSIFKDFVNEFNKNINDIYVIPKIIIFDSTQKKEIIEGEKVVNDSFYKCGGIYTDSDEIIKFIDAKQKEIINYPLPVFTSTGETQASQLSQIELIFEHVKEKKGILMQMFYEIMIEESNTEEYNKFMELLKNNYLNDSNYKDILSQIIDVPDIPVELLSKYYARIYTINGNFYKNMKIELLKGEKENYEPYIPFIKTLFEGIRKKALKTCFQKDLYSAQLINEKEIDNFEKMAKESTDNFNKPTYISKSFISFSKSKSTANNFYNQGKKNAIITLMGYKKEINLYTHADIQDISFYPNEQEVLFFPFSNFEIVSIETVPSVPKRYNIILKYLAEYIEELKKDKKFYNSREKLPDTRFKALIEKTGLIKQEKLNMEIKDVFKDYDDYTQRNTNSKCNKKWWFLLLLLGFVGLFGLIKHKSKNSEEKCQKNYYLYNSKCLPCNPGYYSNAGSIVCSRCPYGQSSYGNGTDCFNCSEGTISNYDIEECTECRAGFYAKEGSSSCSPCPRGTYSGDKAGKCLKCSAGYSSEEESSECTLCGEGTFSKEGDPYCSDCPPGTFSNISGATYCNKCPAGTSPNYEKTSCDKCLVGYYTDTPGSIECSLCPEGTYNTEEGSTSCSLCPVGTYEDNRQCQKCPVTTYSNITGATKCKDCPEGTYNTEEGSTNCLVCPVGTYEVNRQSCQKCQVTTYSNITGVTECIPCPEGTYNSEEGSTDCYFCPLGTYVLNGQSCQKCPRGEYSNITGVTDCIKCPEGSYNTEEGSTNCSICPEGTYAVSGQYCEKCQTGYCSEPGSIECHECP